MAYLTWLVRIVLFLVLLGFAVRNLELVHVHGFLGYEWHAPLVLVMLCALVTGVLIGTVGAIRTALVLRRPGLTAAAEASSAPVGPPRPPVAPAGQELTSDDEGA
jgi:uncharacterized integral membrane protein